MATRSSSSAGFHLMNLFGSPQRPGLTDSGQDLIEYALLASFIAIAGVLVWPQIDVRMAAIFVGWETPVYNIWVPNDPGAP
jgi:hypothetical protein